MKSANPLQFLQRRNYDVAIALGIAIGLIAISTRAGRQLTFDGYHYVEFAKRFATEWPDRFGNHWPFGWSFAAGSLGRLAIPAYPALVALGVLALSVVLFTVRWLIPDHPNRGLILLALGATPALASQIANCLTELPFAAALIVLVWQLGQWPERKSLWGAAGCAVLALSIRYAGLIVLGVLALLLVARWHELRNANQHWQAVFATALAGLICGVLLCTNYLQTGHVSGADRGTPAGLGRLPWELASFGWSAPSALLAGGLRDRIGPNSILGLTIGATVFVGVAGLCIDAWVRPTSRFSRPCAVVTAGYAGGMGFLHCIGEFDALHNARTFVPVLAPLAVITAERCERRTWATGAVCLGLISIGIVSASRGVSREISGDIRAAAHLMAGRLKPGDRIAINDDAISLSAYFQNQTDRVAPQFWSIRDQPAFVVAAGKPTSRAGGESHLSAAWTQFSEQLVFQESYRVLLRQPGLIVLERND